MSVYDFKGNAALNNWGTCLTNNTLYKGASRDFKIELPISLSKSGILSHAIKDDVIIRVYFKKSIVVIPITGPVVPDNLLLFSNCKMYLRCLEFTNNEVACFYKQPKITYPFTKQMNHKYVLNSFNAGQEMTVQLTGFNSVATGCFIFITNTCDNNVNAVWDVSTCAPYTLIAGIDNVYITKFNWLEC